MEQKVGSAFIEIEAKLDKLEWRLTSEIQAIAQKSGQNFAWSFTQALSPLKGMIASIVSAGAFASLSKEIIALADNLEQAKIAFTTMLWSEEKAIAMLQDLSDFARKTPFELPEVRQNAKQLLAMWVSAENIIPTLKALGDAAAWTGADMTRLAMNYGQVITQGHLTGRELRDFLVNGIPLLDELAKNAGKSKEEIQDMISSGEISANDVTRAFETMTSEGGKFEDLMYKQSATFTGLRSNFQDQLSQMGERIGTQFLPQLKSWVEWLSDFIEKNGDDIENLANQIGDTVSFLAENIIGVAQSAGDTINTITEELSDSLSIITGKNDETVTAITGERHDLFYFLQQGFTTIVGIVSIVFTGVFNIIKWVVKGIGDLWSAIAGSWKYALWGLGKWIMSRSDGVADAILWIVNKAIDGLNRMAQMANKLLPDSWAFWTIDNFKSANDLKSSLESLAEEWSQQAFDNVIKLWEQTITTRNEVWDWVKKWADNMMNNLEKNYTKRINSIYDKQIKAQEKALKEQAKNEIESLKKRQNEGEKLTKEEVEKLARLKEYVWEKDYSFTYWDNKPWSWWGGGSSNKEAKKLAQEEKRLIKETEKAYEDIDKAIDKHNKNIEKAEQQVEKLNKKYQDLRQSALDALAETKNAVKDIDGQIESLDKEEDEKMIDKYHKNLDKIKDMERKNKRIGDEASFKSLEEWRSYKDENWDKDIKTKDIIEYLEAKEELKFISSLLTEEQLKEAESTVRMTDAEKDHLKFLEKRGELEYKKAAALEKQAITQAFLNQKPMEEVQSEDDINFRIEKNEQGEIVKAQYRDEKWELQDVVDFKNIQYLQDLTNKALQIEAEKKLLKDKIDDEKKWIAEYDIDRKSMEQNRTILLTNEVDKQKGVIQWLIEKYQALARAKASAGLGGARAFGGDVQAGIPYLVGENYKPEVFVPSTSGSVVPVNNYNQSKSYHFSGVTINANNAQDFWAEIQNNIGDYT